MSDGREITDESNVKNHVLLYINFKSGPDVEKARGGKLNLVSAESIHFHSYYSEFYFGGNRIGVVVLMVA